MGDRSSWRIANPGDPNGLFNVLSAPSRPGRRVLLHLSYSCASPFGPAVLLTQDPIRTSGPGEFRRTGTGATAVPTALRASAGSGVAPEHARDTWLGTQDLGRIHSR
jgi:hypothetical protein